MQSDFQGICIIEINSSAQERFIGDEMVS